MLDIPDEYGTLYNDFAWNIPRHYNIGVDVCDRLAAQRPQHIAIIDVDEAGVTREVSFADLRAQSNQLANALTSLGLCGIDRLPATADGKGEIHPASENRHDSAPGSTFEDADHSGFADRIGILLPQRIETAVAHIAIYKMGCIAIPLFTLFGEDALLHRLRDSGAKAIISDAAGCEKILALRDRLPDLSVIFCVDNSVDALTNGTSDDIADGLTEGVLDFAAACASQSDVFTPVDTRADAPALLIYTSGTTGNPKGALHAHRVLLGHLPGVEMAFDFLPHDGDRFWTPADWAWIGGLLDVLMPSLHHGITVVARRFTRFDPMAALKLMKTHSVRNVFLPPTAMKLMRALDEAADVGVRLRSIASGGEPLGKELNDWSNRVFATGVNEFYGQTECNMIVSSCAALEPPTPGVMGRPVPGHHVEIIDQDSGLPMTDEQEGAIAVRAPDPVMFLGYWNNPQATREKFVDGPDGRWLLTGDRGARTVEGKIRFIGRDDDVIGSAGYRIGPAEVEDCLLKHPAVQLAGVVGKPDAIRGSIVAAYLTLKAGYVPTPKLAEEIAEFVRVRLAAHEYPRVIEFLDEMPMTTTGKIIRATLRHRAASDMGV